MQSIRCQGRGIISDILKRVTLRSTMRVNYWFDWIDEHVDYDRGHTDEENASAWKYASDKTNEYFDSISHGVKDGYNVTLHFKDDTLKEVDLAYFNHNYPTIELR